MTRKRLWMNRISGIVCLLLWIALVIFLSGTTGKIGIRNYVAGGCHL